MYQDIIMKTAVITGAASGIGLALTKTYLQQNVFVVMVDNDNDKLKSESESLLISYPKQLLSIPCDITRAREVELLANLVANNCEQIDYLFNNAGIIGTLSPVWDLQPEQIHRVMDVNLYGTIHMIRAFSPILFKQKNRSHIINMASLYGLCSGSQLSAYSMSKHAVLSLSESLHFDLNRLEKPVDVSIVFPSFTDTSLLAKNDDENNPFHNSLNSLLSHSRPAEEIAHYIAQQVEKKQFYILPDKEVKGYCDERNKAIISGDVPHINNIERLLSALIKRQNK